VNLGANVLVNAYVPHMPPLGARTRTSNVGFYGTVVDQVRSRFVPGGLEISLLLQSMCLFLSPFKFDSVIQNVVRISKALHRNQNVL
jgi:hypothetical protein